MFFIDNYVNVCKCCKFGCSENTIKGVLCYTARGVTKDIFLQNTS